MIVTVVATRHNKNSKGEVGMSSIKKALTGNFAIGIVLLVLGFFSSFVNLNANDYLAVMVGIIFFIVFFISLRSVIQSRNLHNEYKNSWIYRVLMLIRMGGIIIYILGIASKSDHSTGMVFIIVGLTFLLEAGYWSYITRKKHVKVN